MVAIKSDRIIAAVSGWPYELHVFGTDGSFISRLGSRGAGPSDYNLIIYVGVSSSDSVYVFDRINRRVTVLDPGLEFSRAFPLLPLVNGGQSVAILPNSGFLINGSIPSPERFGYPFHLVDASGQLIRSFGVDPGATLDARAAPRAGVRRVRPDGNDGFWAAYADSYIVQHWSLAGALLRTIAHQSQWLNTREPGYSASYPPAAIMDLWVDGDHLWILGRAADPQWAAATAPALRLDPRHSDRRIVDYTGYFDSIVDLWDLKSGQLIGSQAFPDYYVRFVGPRRILGYRENSDGSPILDVVELTFTRKASEDR